MRVVSTGVDSAPREGSIGRDRRCLTGPLRAAARGGGEASRRHPRAAGGSGDGGARAACGAVGRAGGGRGRGRGPLCEPGSARRGRAGPVRSLAGGRPKGGGSRWCACLAIARCVRPASPPGTRDVEMRHGEPFQSPWGNNRCVGCSLGLAAQRRSVERDGDS